MGCAASASVQTSKAERARRTFQDCTWLHGTLHVTVHSAENITSNSHGNARRTASDQPVHRPASTGDAAVVPPSSRSQTPAVSSENSARPGLPNVVKPLHLAHQERGFPALPGMQPRPKEVLGVGGDDGAAATTAAAGGAEGAAQVIRHPLRPTHEYVRPSTPVATLETKTSLTASPLPPLLGPPRAPAPSPPSPPPARTEQQTYCSINIGTTRRGRTRNVAGADNPTWEEALSIPVADLVQEVVIEIVDMAGDRVVGRVTFRAADLTAGAIHKGTFALLGPNNAPLPSASMQLTLQFSPVVFPKGLADDKSPAGASVGVPQAYFPLRDGCDVVLYHDAHQDLLASVEVPLSNGVFAQRSCWTDLYEAICQAKTFIYIAGWSVTTDVKLVREPDVPESQSPCPTIGQLLMNKASQGVKVLVMIWEDADVEANLRRGVAGTRDQETAEYFKNTTVVCCRCPRLGKDDSAPGGAASKTLPYAHNQKAIVLDCEGPDGKRRVEAYMGGLDVATGRYDTSRHPLFDSLNTVHSDDFYQRCFDGSSLDRGGPRQPWHDVHCRLAGPVAHDVLLNFTQRWLKQAGPQAGALVDLTAAGLVTAPQDGSSGAVKASAQLFVMQPHDPEAWRVQLFRSIDSESLSRFPDHSSRETSHPGLMSGHDKAVDASTQTACIHAIRRAQHFIYIESEAFAGSSHLWDRDDAAGATNLVPAELTLKVLSKINAGERFMAYVVLPLFPQGDPGSSAVQAALCWQYNTVCMMYSLVGAALAANGRTDEHPRDYLAFFCLGNREEANRFQHQPGNRPGKDTFYERAQTSRRAAIYVHSKLMIVDDEYIMVGSSNLHQRSLDGSRDSELDMGAYQVGHLADAVTPRGQVYGFRMALWREHLPGFHPMFDQPASLECVHAVCGMAAANWELFAAPQVVDMQGHLMTYPLQVNQDGSVSSLPSCECFPDTDAPVVGRANLRLAASTT